jgi:RNase P subunit RPR2
MSDPAYPGRHTARSYDGPETLAVCPECHAKRYVPDDATNGKRTYCSGCDSLVEWEEF